MVVVGEVEGVECFQPSVVCFASFLRRSDLELESGWRRGKEGGEVCELRFFLRLFPSSTDSPFFSIAAVEVRTVLDMEAIIST